MPGIVRKHFSYAVLFDIGSNLRAKVDIVSILQMGNRSPQA